jgi:hypothetical protein
MIPQFLRVLGESSSRSLTLSQAINEVCNYLNTRAGEFSSELTCWLSARGFSFLPHRLLHELLIKWQLAFPKQEMMIKEKKKVNVCVCVCVCVCGVYLHACMHSC